MGLTSFLRRSPASPVLHIALNRKAVPALERSVPTVKGDASRTLFNVSCRNITWAVLDSGIDGRHEVFKDQQGKSRIIKAFDFSNIRQIVSLDNLYMEESELGHLLEQLPPPLKQVHTAEEVAADLRKLAEDADSDRPMHWELVEKFFEIESTETYGRYICI